MKAEWDILGDDRPEPALEESLGRKVYGVVTGTVIDVLDPMCLGRVRVQLPFLDSIDLSPWARVATMMAGFTYGTYCIPNIGNEVLVVFEHGDVRVPYVIGCLWNSIAPPPLASPVDQKRAIRTSPTGLPVPTPGNQIVFQELPTPSITIQNGVLPVPMPFPASPVGPHQTVELSKTGISLTGNSITLTAGLSSITVTPEGIEIDCGSSRITLNPLSIDIKAGTKVSVKGKGVVEVKGKMVLIN